MEMGEDAQRDFGGGMISLRGIIGRMSRDMEGSFWCVKRNVSKVFVKPFLSSLRFLS